MLIVEICNGLFFFLVFVTNSCAYQKMFQIKSILHCGYYKNVLIVYFAKVKCFLKNCTRTWCYRHKIEVWFFAINSKTTTRRKKFFEQKMFLIECSIKNYLWMFLLKLTVWPKINFEVIVIFDVIVLRFVLDWLLIF